MHPDQPEPTPGHLDEFLLNFHGYCPPEPQGTTTATSKEELKQHALMETLMDQVADVLGKDAAENLDGVDYDLGKRIAQEYIKECQTSPRSFHLKLRDIHDEMTSRSGESQAAFKKANGYDGSLDLAAFHRHCYNDYLHTPEMVWRAFGWLGDEVEPLTLAPIMILYNCLPAHTQVKMAATCLASLLHNADLIDCWVSDLMDERGTANKQQIKDLIRTLQNKLAEQTNDE